MVSLLKLEESTGLQEPRRVMKYVLIWCSAGRLSVNIDENEFSLGSNEVVTITSGQIHYIRQLNGATGYVLEFTLDFFCKDDNDVELIFQNGLFCHFAMNEVIAVSNAQAINEHLVFISNELITKPYQYFISIHSRIELILIEINRAKVERGDEIWKPGVLFLKFLEAVRADFNHSYSVAHFADLLGTSELKLNEQAKLHAGKTAQNVIYGLTVSEAKRLLLYEKLNVKEVAFRMGFKDPFYFSNFFKKHTKQSPKSFQDQHKLF